MKEKKFRGRGEEGGERRRKGYLGATRAEKNTKAGICNNATCTAAEFPISKDIEKSGSLQSVSGVPGGEMGIEGSSQLRTVMQGELHGIDILRRVGDNGDDGEAGEGLGESNRIQGGRQRIHHLL